MHRYIDHTLLSQTADQQAIERLCREARNHDFFAVCVNPVWVGTVSDQLADNSVRICCVAGFPLGANKTEIKVDEAVAAVDDGADEIDVVANIAWLKSNQFGKAEREIRKVRRNLPDDVLLKVIIEVNQLSALQLEAACEMVVESGAEFVKSGTGFFGDVTVAQIESLVRVAAGRIRVKAAGGIRTRAEAELLLKAGAARLGCSRSVQIVNEAL